MGRITGVRRAPRMVAAVGLAISAVVGAGGCTGGIDRAAAAPVIEQAPGSVTYAPTADTYVQGDHATRNYGTSTRLATDDSPVRRAFLRFDISGLTTPVTRAVLRLHASAGNAGSPSGGTIRRVPTTDWSERKMTWRTQPVIDPRPLATLDAVTADTWYDIDVTAAVQGNGTVSFAVVSDSSDGAYYDSREAGDDGPRLVVSTPEPTASPAPPAPAVEADPVLVGAGDIASCTSSGDEATAALLDKIPGAVFAIGDQAYPNGSARDFQRCYEPSWGRHKARTRPAVGNHEYHDADARAYYDYFGPAAGQPGLGYYSYELGAWHIVVLNSNCAEVSCAPGSAQERWLRQDLATKGKACTLAYWHHPLFTSGRNHGPEPLVRPLWQALYDAGAEAVITGHNHQYERFAPQRADGSLDAERGIREFVAGTGGASHYAFGRIAAHSEARNADTYGVLELTLHPTGYDWQFVPQAGRGYADAGSGTCH
jgi:hypothetical protein